MEQKVFQFSRFECRIHVNNFSIADEHLVRNFLPIVCRLCESNNNGHRLLYLLSNSLLNTHRM